MYHLIIQWPCDSLRWGNHEGRVSNQSLNIVIQEDALHAHLTRIVRKTGKLLCLIKVSQDAVSCQSTLWPLIQDAHFSEIIACNLCSNLSKSGPSVSSKSSRAANLLISEVWLHDPACQYQQRAFVWSTEMTESSLCLKKCVCCIHGIDGMQAE